MDMADLIGPDAIIASAEPRSKKQALQDIATLAAGKTGLDEDAVVTALLKRERLGSTGVGQGVAIPHAKMAGLDRVVGAFARLKKPVAFDAVDDKPVDLVFLLLAPEDASAEHLKALAQVSRQLRSRDVREALRAADGRQSVHAALTQERVGAA
ncbi:PTS IIA-like nitrogen-regulatory protein PtsN [Rhodothalassium salexigens]|uniref:PTS IIA-like nitrogen regulatory protein PtsN n=1 Tax=Rhodothalassium salexigens TaxID=1086 RepID=UPI001914924D|nr:PTS IIA-like nitrogen regulatory protein PtsN [Rhodothalassium salexigens]MBK5912234.1 PTS IIA-like nitrogen-regulatory protein PtsN [Rhodothalassium salexigens]